jgi:hypothetical protein
VKTFRLSRSFRGHADLGRAPNGGGLNAFRPARRISLRSSRLRWLAIERAQTIERLRYAPQISPKPALAPRPRPIRGVWIEIGCDGGADSACQSPNDTDTAAVRCGSRRSVGVAQRCRYGPLPSNTNCSAAICRGQPRCIRPPAAGRTGSWPCRIGRRSPCRSHDNDQAGPRRLSGLCAGHVAGAEQRPRSPVHAYDTRPIPIQPGLGARDYWTKAGEKLFGNRVATIGSGCEGDPDPKKEPHP